MKRHFYTVALTMLCGLGVLSARPAHAHFLWAHIVHAPQSTLRLTFGEAAADPTSPRLLSRIKAARAWTAGGATLTLTPGDGAQTSPFPAAQHVAAAEQTWGIYDASAQGMGTFLLHYYAKAADTTAAASAKAGLPVEVFAHREGDRIVARVTRSGKPAPDAEVDVEQPGTAEPPTLKTDAQGEVTFPINASGECQVRAMVAETRSGDYEGKKFTLVRHFSTLTFPVDAVAVKPLSSSRQAAGQADPAAFALLKSAHDSRQTFPAGFPGLTAAFTFDDNGTAHAGTLSFTSVGDVRIAGSDLTPDAKEWVEEQFGNLLGHRLPDDFAKGEGRDALTLGPDDHSPIGRLVELHDSIQSNYRVKDNVVTEVTRTMGGTRFTITVLETTPGDVGKYLPHQFAVTYFDAKTGAITQSELFTDTFTSIDGNWLPISRRVVQAKDGGFTTRTVTLSDFHVQKP